MARIDLPGYVPDFADAIRSFWGTRGAQATRQIESGRVDAGTRGAVTGGEHLDAVAELIATVMTDAGLEPPRPLQLPGFYRRSKNWDLSARYGSTIGAVVELKSQLGSIGNNANNRIEEMIGQAVDLWKAAREQVLGPTPPWFGYVMIVEDSPVSTRRAPVRGVVPCIPARARVRGDELPRPVCHSRLAAFDMSATWTRCAWEPPPQTERCGIRIRRCHSRPSLPRSIVVDFNFATS